MLKPNYNIAKLAYPVYQFACHFDHLLRNSKLTSLKLMLNFKLDTVSINNRQFKDLDES